MYHGFMFSHKQRRYLCEYTNLRLRDHYHNKGDHRCINNSSYHRYNDNKGHHNNTNNYHKGHNNYHKGHNNTNNHNNTISCVH